MSTTVTAKRLPIRWDLTGEDAITQGADWTRYRAIEVEDTTTGVVTTLDFTGYTGRMTIRSDYDDEAALAITTDDYLSTTLVTDSAGEEWSLTIELPSAVTAALEDWGRGVYDLEVEDGFGNVTRVYEGIATLSREVSY